MRCGFSVASLETGKNKIKKRAIVLRWRMMTINYNKEELHRSNGGKVDKIK